MTAAAKFVEDRAVAEALRISPRHVRRLVGAGVIPATRIGPRCLRFDPDAVGAAVGTDADNARQIAKAIQAADETLNQKERI